MDKTWKALERRVAAFFGTQRTSLSGGNSKQTRSDTLHPQLFIECKQGKVVPGYSLFQKTKALALKEKKIPLVVFHKTNSKDTLVLMRLQDLRQIHHLGDRVPF